VQWANLHVASPMSSSWTTLSVLTVIADGMDQAKFKVPRLLGPKVKALDNFPRPALHNAGVWAHGHCFHLSISPPDVPKDTNTNIEAISRVLDAVLERCKSLPNHLMLQLDNTCRDNKNQKMFRWGIRCVQTGVFRSVTLHFLRKGHTHEDIDGVFGQLAAEIASNYFDTPSELTEIMCRKLKTVGVDSASRDHSHCYQMDEVADWESLCSRLRVQFSRHGGPNAPHVFKFVLRSDLQLELAGEHVAEEPEPGGAKRGDDVMMLCKHYMSSRTHSQVSMVLPGGLHHHMRQPEGNRPKIPKAAKLVRSIFAECARAADQNLISQSARGFLESWATDNLPVYRRPSKYSYLEYDWQRGQQQHEQRTPQRTPIMYDGLSLVVNQVRVQAVPIDGGDAAEEEADDLAGEDNNGLMDALDVADRG
jgi:hypothetical protein